MKKRRKLTRQALLLALSLIIYVVETALPPLLPGVPGVRLGLSNVFVLYALWVMGISPAVWIMVLKSILGPIFSGAPTAMFYALAGGGASLAVMIVLKRVLRDRIGLAGISVAGALCHNAAQIAVAALFTSTAAIFSYLPVLAAMSVPTGIFTGLLAAGIARMTKSLWNASTNEEDNKK